MDDLTTRVKSLPKELYSKIYELGFGVAPIMQEEGGAGHEGRPVEASRMIFVSDEMLGTYVPGIGFCDCEDAVAVTPRAVDDFENDDANMADHSIIITPSFVNEHDAVIASIIADSAGVEDSNSENEV